MFKKSILCAVCYAAIASQASAGDTVTVNSPAGATGAVSSATTAGAITTSMSAGVVLGPGGADSSIASITQDPATGAITATSAGGRTFTVSSAFIGSLLAYYK